MEPNQIIDKLQLLHANLDEKARLESLFVAWR